MALCFWKFIQRFVPERVGDVNRANDGHVSGVAGISIVDSLRGGGNISEFVNRSR